MAKRQRTPQEKKTLSLSKDRRNTYGENSKSSRKNIPLSKALAQRQVRHKANQELDAIASRDDERVDVTESTLSKARAQKPKWKKVPDEPLSVVLMRKKNM
jgi:hypothetical protein